MRRPLVVSKKRNESSYLHIHKYKNRDRGCFSYRGNQGVFVSFLVFKVSPWQSSGRKVPEQSAIIAIQRKPPAFCAWYRVFANAWEVDLARSRDSKRQTTMLKRMSRKMKKSMKMMRKMMKRWRTTSWRRMKTRSLIVVASFSCSKIRCQHRSNWNREENAIFKTYLLEGMVDASQ